jgi:histidinol dehydrogenase
MRVIHGDREDPLAALGNRQASFESSLTETVGRIIEDVRQRGDQALLENARQFDAPLLDSIKVSEVEIAIAEVSPEHLRAIRMSRDRVCGFCWEQLERLFSGKFHGFDELRTYGERLDVRWNNSRPRTFKIYRPDRFSEEGIVGQRVVSLASAGIYVPGGQASYPSSVIMNAGPALVAGVEKVIVTTPARPDGSLAPSVLAAMRELEVSTAFKIGGAAAIAALALGTESIARVDKIVGPGNRFVNEAKRQLWGSVGLDGFAGPSEVCVLADDQANAIFAAVDLLTQIEHAPDNLGFLVCVSEAKLHEVQAAVERLLAGSERESTMREALKLSLAFVARDMEQAIDIVNAIAPEHLSLAVANPDLILDKIRNAGCVLMGEHTPESAADYCAGPSHTLPTSGAARFESPVNVLDFLKIQSVVSFSPGDLERLAPTIEAFAQMEGLPMHGKGATLRRE